MGIKISLLKGKTKTFVFTYDGESMSVTYRPSEVTAQVVQEMRETVESGKAEVGLIDMMQRMLVSWEVMDEAGEVLPITQEILQSLPLNFVTELSMSLNKDNAPEGTEGEVSRGSLGG